MHLLDVHLLIADSGCKSAANADIEKPLCLLLYHDKCALHERIVLVVFDQLHASYPNGLDVYPLIQCTMHCIVILCRGRRLCIELQLQ